MIVSGLQHCLVRVVGMGQPYEIVTYVPVLVGRISGTGVLPDGHVSHLFLKISSVEVSAVSLDNLFPVFHRLLHLERLP